jgi:predicted nicotinamide N-methyase
MNGIVASSLGLALNGGPVDMNIFNIIVQEPQSVLCTLDNQNADDIRGSCQQLDTIIRWRANRLFTIKQDWGGSASTGAAVWNGANMAIWYLEHGLPANALNGAKTVELGAGIGFTSLVANALGATDVTITDGDPDVLKLAEKNIDLNVEKTQLSQIKTARLRWSTEDETPFLTSERPTDYIFISDCTYKKAAWKDLMGTVQRLSGPETKTILSMEPRNVGEVEGVLAEARAQGLTVSEERLPVDAKKTQCSLLCARLFTLSKLSIPVS